LVADCIIGRQRTALVETALLGARRDFLRNVLALPPRRKRDVDGSAAEVASRLGPETQLQLLLILSDRDLVSLIDEAVFSNAIRIPLAEIRRPLYMPPRLPQEAGSQLSALGLRSARQDPVVNLTFVIWRAYQRLSHINELEWRVRGDASLSPYEALVAFLRNHGPADSVRDLILASAEITMAVCEDLQVPLKYASGADDQVVDRLLWKLGFNPMQFDDSISRLKARLSELNEAVLANTPIGTEDARERIRAAGVNVFVSVEDFIDRLVSYNIWLLSSDHFLTTKFHYSSVAGRRSVAQTLGYSLPTGDVTFSWNISGENPLGTLLRYLRAATDWIQSLLEKDCIHLERPGQDLPHFADDEHLPFPFRHVAWFGSLSRG